MLRKKSTALILKIYIAYMVQQRVVVSYGRHVTLLHFAEGSGAA